MTSPKSGALRIVTSSGSRFMISALRNGPMRLIEINSVSTAMVTVTLTTNSAIHPVPVCGGCQFQVFLVHSFGLFIPRQIGHLQSLAFHQALQERMELSGSGSFAGSASFGGSASFTGPASFSGSRSGS